MGLSVGNFFVEFVQLPGTILNGLVSYTFGYTEKNEDGEVVLDDNTFEPIVHHGAVSLLLKGISVAGRMIADFFNDHKTAISTAFWSSLIIAGGVALTLFLWPAALTAAASFPVFGFSIAGIVGADALLQIGFASALAFAATSAFTYLSAAVVNTIAMIARACCGEPDDPDSSYPNEEHLEYSSSNSHSKMQDLESRTPKEKRQTDETNPTNNNVLTSSRDAKKYLRKSTDEIGFDANNLNPT